MTLLQMSAMGSVLIILTMILRRVVGDKISPGTYCSMWALAGTRLLLPIEVSSPFSVYQFLSVDSDNITVFYEPIMLSELHEIYTTLQPMEKGLMFVNIQNLIWLCGVVLCLGIIVLKHWRSRTLYSTSLPVESSFVLKWMQEHKLYRKYRIRVCQQITVPLTYGLIVPVILLPSNHSMSEKELDMVLLHEWNHIRHFDVLWQWMLVVICSIHWFNPLVWMMFVLCLQDMELFCDQATVKSMKAKERSAYAYFLLQQLNSSKKAPLFMHFCFTGYQKMEERIRVIMKQRSFSRKTLFMTVILLCICGLCFATTAMGGVNSEKELIDIGNGMIAENEQIKLVWPVQSEEAVLTMKFGKRIHPITKESIQIDHICIGGVKKGSNIIAATNGVVKETGYDTRLGNYIVLQCENDVILHYWHCEDVLVTEGTDVNVCDIIATLGQTGDATGPCLSFAMYQNEKAVDPLLYMDKTVINK